MFHDLELLEDDIPYVAERLHALVLKYELPRVWPAVTEATQPERKYRADRSGQF